jgi:hypothetical protein
MSSNLKIIFNKFFILYKLVFRFFKFSQGGKTCIKNLKVKNIILHSLNHKKLIFYYIV